jgi:hypothetical protein
MWISKLEKGNSMSWERGFYTVQDRVRKEGMLRDGVWKEVALTLSNFPVYLGI